MDFPKGLSGENLLVKWTKSGGKAEVKKASVQLRRAEGFTGRLPFEGTWYVAAEHGYLDPHKRFLAEAFAYDFVQIGPNGKSYQRDGRSNADYYAYGKKVFAAKDGTVVTVRSDVAENSPGESTNLTTPSGNVVIIDHGNNQFGYYAHLKPFTVSIKAGARVRAGDVLGEVGNSGDSSEPHLHFHVMNNADPEQADGIPLLFETWKAQSYSRFPVVRQLGILAESLCSCTHRLRRTPAFLICCFLPHSSMAASADALFLNGVRYNAQPVGDVHITWKSPRPEDSGM